MLELFDNLFLKYPQVEQKKIGTKYFDCLFVIFFITLNIYFRWISNFSLSKAAEAFQNIETYAANLLNQSWRVEYRTIKQVNNFLT